ncbi:ALG6, ALG8 glycosyltransferase [Wilcoxina mikolae CBS 423.85]|nr:ALG6, ALG8 glycosyltransferase [Wilcoxina mikolae CBS 423.85]
MPDLWSTDAQESKTTTESALSRPVPVPFPLASFFQPLRRGASRCVVLSALLMIAFLYRWAVGLGPYSGMAAPPMHGDFEAQRHWMELTTQLPMKEWYWHDLEWWGLDYPPLTAYHSWLVGIIGTFIDPTWFKLHDSRGLDDELLKVFMRASVVISEYLIYVPAVMLFVWVYGKQAGLSTYEKAIALAAILFQPSLMLIDHGHFQFNSVMFGFAFFAVDCFITDHILWGSFFFVLSICFKQMALYYAPAVFAYLLGLCIFPRIDIQRLFYLSSVVIGTFVLIFAPLVLFGGSEQIQQCLFRVFPFARGLWEDKVANFWCATNVALKFRETFAPATLQLASLWATLAGILPPCVLLFLNPEKRLLPLGLSACAWSFFLFSFQVHEKSVLLPLLPATLLLGGSLSQDTMSWVVWMNNIGMFSLWPLLRRDGLVLQYIVMSVFYAWLLGTFHRLPEHWFAKLTHVGSYCAILVIHTAEQYVGTVERYPDLWVVGNVLLCFGSYVIAWAWTLQRLWMETRRGKQKTE